MKKTIGCGFILMMLFVITNPTPSDFQTYLEANVIKPDPENTSYGRANNYFLFSIYRVKTNKNANHIEFIGFLKNFYYKSADSSTYKWYQSIQTKLSKS
jgi:hypothetical protein